MLPRFEWLGCGEETMLTTSFSSRHVTLGISCWAPPAEPLASLEWGVQNVLSLDYHGARWVWRCCVSSVPAGGRQLWQLCFGRAALEDLVIKMVTGYGLAAGLWVAVAHSGSAGVSAVPDTGADHQRPQKPGAVCQGGPS